MIALQEELDWTCYGLYALVENPPITDLQSVPVLRLGQRAFEIVLARKMAAGEVETTWFERHGSTPITENAKLPEAIVRTIDEVIAFQASLKAKRLHRLTQDRQDLQRELKVAEGTIHEESEALDAKMRYLGEHRALDEYVAVTQELAALQVQIARLEERLRLSAYVTSK